LSGERTRLKDEENLIGKMFWRLSFKRAGPKMAASDAASQSVVFYAQSSQRSKAVLV